MLLDVGRCWGLIVAAFALLAWQPSWWAGALAFVTIGTQQYALSVLAQYLRPRKTLLLLDNCEHLVIPSESRSLLGGTDAAQSQFRIYRCGRSSRDGRPGSVAE